MQYPTDDEGYAVAFDDPVAAMDEHNIAVVRVLTDAECEAAVAAFWIGANATGRLDPADPSTWDDANWPDPGHPFLWDGQDTQPATLAVTTHPAIERVFTALYRSTDLVATVGVYGIKRPTIVAGRDRPEWRTPALRLHWDRDTAERYDSLPPRYQSLVALVDCDHRVGSFAAVPGSADAVRRDPRLWLAADQGKYVPRGQLCGWMHGAVQRLPLRRGHMVVWEVGVAHANYENHSDLPRIALYFRLLPSALLGLDDKNMRAYLARHPEAVDAVRRFGGPREQALLGGQQLVGRRARRHARR